MTANRWFIVTLSLIVLCQELWAQTPDNRLSLVHADMARGRPDVNETVRELVGNVKFRQGDAVLTCERAIQFVESGKSVLQGNVFYKDSVKQLTGRRLTFYRPRDLFVLDGNARLAEVSKILTAKSISYDRSSDRAEARMKVLLADTANDLHIRCEAAVYEQPRGYALCTGNPVFSQADTSNADTLYIHGTRFEMFHNGDTLLITGDVRMQRGTMTARCDTLEYFTESERVTLRPVPRVWQDKDYLTGETILLQLQDSELISADILNNAVAVTAVDSAIQTRVPYDLLTGGDMKVYITDEAIDSIIVRRQATSYYHVIDEGRENGVNKALGDLLKIKFSGNELSKVHLFSDPGVSNGEFHPKQTQGRLEDEMLEKLNQYRVLEETP
ncbi:MAG: OstA-like protein [candidate division KSB1 bacterium]|nr:OstA-like protein [candidate division KSB1 bacterium]